MEESITQVTTTKKVSTKLLATIAIIAVVLLTFIIGGLVILASNNRNNNSNGNNNTTVTPTPTSLAQCEYNGIKYDSGQSFDKGDSCNTCNCEDGRVSCEEKVCNKSFTQRINKYDVSGQVYGYYNLTIEAPSDSEVEYKTGEFKISNFEYAIYILGVPDFAGGFKKKLIHENIQEGNYRLVRINDDQEIDEGNIYNISELHTDTLEQWFFYSSDYGEGTECIPFTFNNQPTEVCGSQLVRIPYNQNPENKELVFIHCGTNSNNEVRYCDNIVKAIRIEKI